MNGKPRILFVDDEELILQGLRRMLRPMRTEWEMDFQLGGAEALEAMAINHCDVLISDMRMPGMSGAELLNATMRLYPSTVRIILSGQSDYESLMQGVASTHQYLAKPCDDQVLIGSIRQALALKQLLNNEQLLTMVTGLKLLPSKPPLYVRIIERLQEPEAYVKEITEIIVQDPAMAAQILKLVNTAFFGLSVKISAIDEAVSYLGLQTLRLMVLSIGLFEEFHQMQADSKLLESIWAHSLEVARTARAIVELEGGTKAVINETFTSGLLHDIGELVFAVNYQEKYQTCMECSLKDHEAMFKVETRKFGAPHSHVGAYLLGLWGLPTKIVETVACHHLPSERDSTSFSSLTAVHAADIFVHQKKRDLNLAYAGEIDHLYFDRIQMENRLPVWWEAVRNL